MQLLEFIQYRLHDFGVIDLYVYEKQGMKLRLRTITLMFAMIIASKTAVAKTSEVIPPIRTIGLTLLGTALLGPGITYDHSFANRERGYAYWRGGVSFQYIWEPGLFPSVGVGYSRSISKSKKYFIGAGFNAGGLIAFKPTPKYLRDYWDSIEFYGGNYVYPVELIMMPELNFSYIAERWYLRLELLTLLVYDRVGQDQIRVVPWAGVTSGFRIGRK
jgi:hypothetical protein